MQALDREDPERDEASQRLLSKCPGARPPFEANGDALLLEHDLFRKPVYTFGPTRVRSKALILRLESHLANRLPAKQASLSP